MNNSWGHIYWNFLHTMSFEYPENPNTEDMDKYKQFILLLPYILPCKRCKLHLLNIYKTHPIKHRHLKNRENFSFYVYQLHNIINMELQKKYYIPYELVKRTYTNSENCNCVIHD